MTATPSGVSLAASVAALPDAVRRALLATLSDDEARALAYDWSFWARPEQLPPAGTWSFWLLSAGRGFGKTRTGAECVRSRVERGLSGRIGLVAPTSGDARDVMVEGESGLLAVSPPWDMPVYEPSKRRVTWRNGARATLYSADEPDRLRGPQHDLVWGDEIATWRYPEAMDNLLMGLRLGTHPVGVFTTTPKPVRLVKELIADPTCVVTRGSTYANIGNLAPVFIRTVLRRYEGTRKGRQELHAELLEDVAGALWTLELIERGRLTLEQFRSVQLGRTVVAVDPNVSSGEDADDAGVVAVARGVGRCPCGREGCLYVLEDRSGQHAPIDWARQAVALYHGRQADRIVAEVNNGGDLVEMQLRVVDDTVAYTGVHAAKGKRTRGEPVSALYEQGRVHHVGAFPQLEEQLTQWVPDAGMPSPGRLDALVWAVTELGLTNSAVDNIFAYYEQEIAKDEEWRRAATAEKR